MRIQKLYSRAAGREVYIVGTGPSLRTFPLDFLRGKITIGLNQAWRHFPVNYSLTVHPELVLEYLKEKKVPRTLWVLKRKAPMQDIGFDDKRHIVFRTSEDLAVLRKRPKDTLYLGRGIQCTALDLAARMGASAAILVGVDGGPLGGEHHGHAQHVRWNGLPPSDVYAEYRRFTARTRKHLREACGLKVLCLTPFVSVTSPEEDYTRLCKEQKLSPLPTPPDTSAYRRDRADP